MDQSELAINRPAFVGAPNNLADLGKTLSGRTVVVYYNGADRFA